MQPLKPWIFGNLQSEPILRTKLLQFCQDAIGDGRYTLTLIELNHQNNGLTLCHETIHHPLNELNLVLYTEIYEIRIDQYPEWWT